MNPSLLSLFSFIFSLTFLFVTICAAPEPVLDISGQKLRTGVKYNIIPVLRGKGGGLTLTPKGKNNTCPLYVVQESIEVFNGQPVTFTPYNTNKGVIFTSTDLNIKSSLTPTTTSCGESPVWKLLKELTGVWFLSTGGVEGNPGVDTINNWFKIEKQDKNNNYVISFCPSVCKCQTLCRALGIYTDDDGKKHLALSDQVAPFAVKFIRAKVQNI